MPGGCDSHPVRLCVCERLCVTDVAVSCWTVCRSAYAGWWDRAGLCSSASLLWGWTMCGPVHQESYACVPVSFRDRAGPHGKLSNCWSLNESRENTAPGSYFDPSPAEEWRS